MLYGGILGYKYNELKDEDCTYVDKARRVIIMPSSEANGFSDGNVSIFFDLITGNLMTITERVVNNHIDSEDKVSEAISNFNNKQKRYIAYSELSDDGMYIDISVTTIELFKVIEEAYS